MEAADSKSLLPPLADKYALRYVDFSRRYLGIVDGVCVDVREWDGTIYFYFFSPTASLVDAVLERFQGFTHLAQTAVPVSWLQGRVVGSDLDQHGCVLELSPERIAAISKDDFQKIPEAVVKDLHAFGAERELPGCSLCSAPNPTKLMFADNLYQFACPTCFDTLNEQYPDGARPNEVAVQWRRVWPILVFGSIAFTLVWGWLQQPSDRMDGRLLLAAPFAGSLYFCRSVGRAAQGMNLLLRIVASMCVIGSILAGNIWGFRSALLARPGAFVSWIDTAYLYITIQLPANNAVEGWYLLGGIAGVWLGFNMLKRQEIVIYE